MLSEASELSVWAGRPAVLEEVHRLQTRWDQLASGSVLRRENLEVELKVCMELLPTVVVVVVVVVIVVVVVVTITTLITMMMMMIIIIMMTVVNTVVGLN